MRFSAPALLLLDPISERVLASWELVRGRKGGGEWSMGGWRVDQRTLRDLVQADAVTISDALRRLGSMDLLEAGGGLRPAVTAYLSRRTMARLGVRPAKAAAT